MASYVVKGYSPPSGVTSKDAVKQMQQQLGVKADGVWGPNTQAAYDAQQNYQSQLESIRSMISGIGGGFSGGGSVDREKIRADIEAALRPTYDSYIDARKKQTTVNRSEIDVDAASRGLTSSTWLTDAKARQMDAEAGDIAGYETQYAGALANAVNDAAAAQQSYNLQASQASASARAQAAGLAMQLMQLEQQYKPTYTTSGGSGGSYGGAIAKALSTIPAKGTPTLAGNKKVTVGGKTVQILKGH